MHAASIKGQCVGSRTDRERGSRRSWSLVALSFHYLRRYRGRSLVALLTMLVDTAFTIAFYFGMKVLIDAAVHGDDAYTLVRTLAELAGFFLVATLANLARESLQSTVEVRLADDLRVAMLNHLQHLGLDFYLRTRPTDLFARFSVDVTTIKKALTGAFATVIRYAIQLVAVCVLLAYLDWRLAAIVVLALGMVMAMVRVVVRWSSQQAAGYMRDTEDVLTAIQEATSGLLVLKVFRGQGTMLASMKAKLDQIAPGGVRAGLLGRLMTRVIESGVAMIQLLVGGIGVLGVSRHTISVGTLAAFLGLLTVSGSSLIRIALGLPEWLASAEAMRRVADIFDERPRVVDEPDAVALPRFSEEIRFADVSFSYPGEEQALRHMTLTIAAGQSVAFVGRNGAGKSTLLALLLHLWDPSDGRITVDGHDLRAMTQDSWHAQVGVVFQETLLFNRSVRDNICLDRPASDEEIEAVARAAQVHDVIINLPNGYNTVIGEHGGRLSGGQSRRLVLARALLHDPAVLVLDEATASLDPTSEAAFAEAVQRMAGRRTIVSVTHRLAAVIDADCIFVMDKGSIVEQGTHEELLGLDGVYRGMWDKQTGFVVDEAGRRARVTAQRLRLIPLFASLDERYLATLADQFETERYDAGQTIIEQGDAGEMFYLMVRGSAQVLLTHRGEERYLDTLQDGDYFGEMALLADIPRTATVRAATSCLLLALRRYDFQDLLNSVPDVRVAINQLVKVREQRISALNEQS